MQNTDNVCIEETNENTRLHMLVDKVCILKRTQPISVLTQELSQLINAGVSIDTKRKGMDYSQIILEYFLHGKVPVFIYDGLTVAQQIKIWIKVHNDADTKKFLDAFESDVQNRRSKIKEAVRQFLEAGPTNIVFQYYEIEKFNHTDEEIMALEKNTQEKSVKLFKLTSELPF